jgi:chemotaxis protein MotB
MAHGRIRFAAFALIALMSVGCVSQQQYDDLQLLYRRTGEQVVDLKAKLEEANARIKALQEAANRGSNDPELQAKLAQALADRDRLAKALADAENALKNRSDFGAVVLEKPLDEALRALAAAHPDLISYDPARGMVRFNSDLTFPLGSTEIGDEAVATLKKLAEIVRAPLAEKYEVKIVGHTDAVRISKPDTKAKHPTNWHLSVHRSIAVKDVLESAGVQPVRLSVVGQGEFRPVAANGAKGDNQANRRVEIYLVPNSYSGPTGGAPAHDAGKAPKAKKPADAPNDKVSAPKAEGAAEPVVPEAFK